MRALFREFTPIGAPPVTVAGINYELINQLEPAPGQVISLAPVSSGDVITRQHQGRQPDRAGDGHHPGSQRPRRARRHPRRVQLALSHRVAGAGAQDRNYARRPGAHAGGPGPARRIVDYGKLGRGEELHPHRAAGGRRRARQHRNGRPHTHVVADARADDHAEPDCHGHAHARADGDPPAAGRRRPAAPETPGGLCARSLPP